MPKPRCQCGKCRTCRHREATRKWRKRRSWNAGIRASGPQLITVSQSLSAFAEKYWLD